MGKRKATYFLYEQIAKEIRDKIHSDNLPEGYQLPSEVELCQHFGASLPTVRRAIEELKWEGNVEVLRGKGTFVKKPKTKDIRILDFNGYTDGMGLEDSHYTKTIISKNIRISTIEEMETFHKEKKFKVLELVRGVYEDEKPFSLDYAYFPLYLYPNINKKITEEVSTFHVLKEEYGVVFSKAHKSIEFLTNGVDQKSTNFLTLGKRRPLISVKKEIEDDKGRIIHYSHFFLLPSLLKFTMDIDFKK